MFTSSPGSIVVLSTSIAWTIGGSFDGFLRASANAAATPRSSRTTEAMIRKLRLFDSLRDGP
jgi:hypothetical protein